jgi:predicted transporter
MWRTLNRLIIIYNKMRFNMYGSGLVYLILDNFWVTKGALQQRNWSSLNVSTSKLTFSVWSYQLLILILSYRLVSVILP